MNIQNNSPNIVDEALECVARGWHVFPALISEGVKKSHKSAAHSGGREWGATTDPDEIRRDWARWPDAQLGIVTGQKSNLFVIEADTLDGHGVDGVANLQNLINQHGTLPHTIEAESPTGSWHLYFRYPEHEEIKNSAGKIAPGVDVRGDGGMIIAPPSFRSDKNGAYVWKNPPGFFELADCPEWLLARGIKPKIADQTVARIDTAQAFDKAVTGLNEIAELLDFLHPDAEGYDTWCTVLMALHDHTNGSNPGLQLAERWSAKGPKYKPGEVAKKWKSFVSGGGVGIATIADMARKGGADLSEIARKHRSTCDPKEIRAHQDALNPAPPSDNPDRPEIYEYDLSHDALASDLGAHSFDQDARYVATWGKWVFWDGKHWQIDDRLDHMTRTRAYLRAKADELTSSAERQSEKDGQRQGKKLFEQAKERARSLRSKNTVMAVESLARSNPASVSRADAFDENRLLLGTPGGTVDLRTGTLRPSDRGDMITKLTACAPAPSGKEPKLWMKFLHEIFDGDTDLIAFIQRLSGYALTGATSEHKLFFLYGTGRNGKSVLLNTLMHIWADYARRAAAETFINTQGDKHATGLAGLQGARLVVGSELPIGKAWDESVIKDLTGGDRITARYMRGDFFDFDPQLTLMIAGNNQPSFRGVDEAIRARMVLIPFTVTVPPEKRDTSLPEKLLAEAPAILRWAIEGAQDWLENGLKVPAKIAAASAEYMDDEDILGQFLIDETVSDAQGFVTTTALHDRFNSWCDQQGLQRWTQRTLQKEMKSRNWQAARRNYGRGFIGLKLA